MNAPAPVLPGRTRDPLVFDAIGEAANIAASYADAAVTFAAVGDGRGVNYALRCAAAALATAHQAATMLRLAEQGEAPK